ncbi:MAG: MBL fold metallo-hydrolase [Ruminococcaceae bacterium]|nr:MBL fold metallo-hydrolase [Oscillospiraceae bacterium]
MYELVKISDISYYIQSPAKIGIYLKNDCDAYLIDSGNDKDAGRRCKKILDEQGWCLKGILITHSNADHIGGCAYLQSQYGCKVFAGGIEAAFTKNPILEPAFLYGGFPFSELKHKFLMAQPCDVSSFEDADFPKEVEIIPLPGHFFDMVGFKLPDGTFFIADCLSSETALEKYHLSFLYDAEAYLKTLEALPSITASVYIPSHAQPTKDISDLAKLNRDKVMSIATEIVTLCSKPVTFEELLDSVFTHYALTMTYEQYVLIGSTLRSYLAWLKESGKITCSIDGNRIVWQAV